MGTERFLHRGGNKTTRSQNASIWTRVSPTAQMSLSNPVPSDVTLFGDCLSGRPQRWCFPGCMESHNMKCFEQRRKHFKVDSLTCYWKIIFSRELIPFSDSRSPLWKTLKNAGNTPHPAFSHGGNMSCIFLSARQSTRVSLHRSAWAGLDRAGCVLSTLLSFPWHDAVHFFPLVLLNSFQNHHS